MKHKTQVIDVAVGFEVVDESDEWIVVNKPAPLVVHPTSGKAEPTLLGGVKELLSYEIANGVQLSIINRLDRETSGLVLIAKSKEAARRFGLAMEARQIGKVYQGILAGWPEWDELDVNAPLLRQGDVEESAVWVKQYVHEAGRPSATRFRVESRYQFADGAKVTKVRIEPHTGRMHQIRVHASYCGYPLIGDKIYGPSEACYLEYIESGWSEQLQEKLRLPRHALHASEMAMLDGSALSWKIAFAADLEAFLNGAEMQL